MEAGWTPLHEAARRLLREDGTDLAAPVELAPGVHALDQAISEAHPVRLAPITHLPLPDAIEVRGPTGTTLARLGGPPPDSLDVCWVPPGDGVALAEVLVAFAAACDRLLQAGYPGCIDCLGPAAAEPWDEAGSRAALLAVRS